MPLGFAGAYGAAGAADALQQLIAQRKADALRQAQLELQQRQQAAEEAAQAFSQQRMTQQDTLSQELLRRKLATENFQMLEGRDTADLPGTDMPITLPDMLGGGAPSTLPFKRITPMEIPGVGGMGAMSLRPRTSQEMRQAKDEAARISLSRGEKLVSGTGRTIAEGEPYQSAPPNLGSFEDYVGRKFGPNPTPQQIEEGRKLYGQADDRVRVGGGQLSQNQELLAIQKFQKQWDTATQPVVNMRQQVNRMHEGLQAAERGDLAQGSQAVLVVFQKILDPTSVVRESEYMRSAAGQSLLNQVKGAAERLARGGAGVPLPELKKYAQLAEDMSRNQNAAYLRSVRGRLESTAKKYGLDPDLIFTDVGLDEAPTAGAPKKMSASEWLDKQNPAGRGQGPPR